MRWAKIKSQHQDQRIQAQMNELPQTTALSSRLGQSKLALERSENVYLRLLLAECIQAYLPLTTPVNLRRARL